MHVRRDRKKLKDGSARTYVSFAHNVWTSMAHGGKKRSRPIVFANLGAEEDLDIGVASAMRGALDRYIQRRLREEAEAAGEEAPAVERIAKDLRPKLQPLRILASVDFGMRRIVESVWTSLGLRKAFEKIAASHDLSWAFERVVFGMVLNRLVDPKSKRACNEWLRDEAWFPEAEGWDVQQFYRALDLLEEHADEVDAAVVDALRDNLPDGSLALMLIDTTSSYFETDYDDVERAEIAQRWSAFDEGETEVKPRSPRPQVVNEPPMRMRGHSKDKRPDLPQVVIGLMSTVDGRPIRHRVFPGNRNDQTITQMLVDDSLEIGEGLIPVVACDSGMGGEPNLVAIDALPRRPHRISAVPLRIHHKAEEILARAGRWRRHPTKADFELRVVQVSADELVTDRPEVWLATRNQKAADRERRRLDRHEAQVRELLAKDDRASGHGSKGCKLLSDRTLKKYVRVSEDGRRLLPNRARLARERHLAGVRVIRTTLVDQAPEVILQGYESLLRIEDNFRTYKGPLRLRPMHHRADRRIRAHVRICTLALLCLRELELRTGMRFDDLTKLVGPIKAARVEQGGVRFWQRSEWGQEALAILTKLGETAGSTTWGAEPRA